MLLRGMLDPWNEIYYQLPFLVSLGAWEVCSGRRAPLFTLAASVLVWLSFEPVTPHLQRRHHQPLLSPLDASGGRADGLALVAPDPTHPDAAPRYSTTVSSLESRVSTS